MAASSAIGIRFAGQDLLQVNPNAKTTIADLRKEIVKNQAFKDLGKRGVDLKTLSFVVGKGGLLLPEWKEKFPCLGFFGLIRKEGGPYIGITFMRPVPIENVLSLESLTHLKAAAASALSTFNKAKTSAKVAALSPTDKQKFLAKLEIVALQSPVDVERYFGAARTAFALTIRKSLEKLTGLILVAAQSHTYDGESQGGKTSLSDHSASGLHVRANAVKGLMPPSDDRTAFNSGTYAVRTYANEYAHDAEPEMKIDGDNKVVAEFITSFAVGIKFLNAQL